MESLIYFIYSVIHFDRGWFLTTKTLFIIICMHTVLKQWIEYRMKNETVQHHKMRSFRLLCVCVFVGLFSAFLFVNVCLLFMEVKGKKSLLCCNRFGSFTLIYSNNFFVETLEICTLICACAHASVNRKFLFFFLVLLCWLVRIGDHTFRRIGDRPNNMRTSISNLCVYFYFMIKSLTHTHTRWFVKTSDSTRNFFHLLIFFSSVLLWCDHANC